EDEQHRDHVEADAEPEGARDLAGQSALVGLVLDLVRPPRSDQTVQERQGSPGDQTEAGEDDHWEEALEHGAARGGLYTSAGDFVPRCYIVIFRINKPESTRPGKLARRCSRSTSSSG